MKKTIAFILAFTLVAGVLPVNTGNSLKWNTNIVAYAAGTPYVEENNETGEHILHLAGNINPESMFKVLEPFWQEETGLEGITSVIADEGTVLPEDCRGFFAGLPAKTIDLSNADASNVTNMESMFWSCTNLTTINFGENFGTSNVTNMMGMFSNCSALTELDLSSFDTSSVTDMSRMFANCSALTELDLGSFDTSNVMNIFGMFSECHALSSLTLSKKFAQGIQSGMGLPNLTNGGWYITSPDYIITNEYGTEEATISTDYINETGTTTFYKYDPDNFTYVQYEDGRYVLYLAGRVDADVISYALSKETYPYINDSIRAVIAKEGTVLSSNCNNLFSRFPAVENIDLSNANTANVTDMSYMFHKCNLLKTINFGNNFNTSNVTNMEAMFSECKSLTNLDLSSFDTSNVTNMEDMFFGCRSLTNLDLSSFDTSNVTNMQDMFMYCYGLTTLDLRSFDTSKVENMTRMFCGNHSLESLNLSSFDTSNVDYTYAVFGGCSALKSLTLSKNFKQGITDDMELPNVDGWYKTKYSIISGNDKNAKINAEQINATGSTVFYKTDFERTYQWSEDGKSCNARAVCKNDPQHIVEETAVITSTVKIAPSSTTAGEIIYTATFTNDAFTTQTKDVIVPAGSENTVVEYTVEPSYTVTIPATVALGNTATISAENVMLNSGETLNVKLMGTSEEDNTFKLKSSVDELTYTVLNGNTPVTVGSSVLSVQAGTAIGSTTLKFNEPTVAPNAGDYTGTVTFTISIDKD